MWSPGWTFVAAAPFGGLDAVDVVEPVHRHSAFLPAGQALDALHEAAAVAGAHARVAHQQAHDGLLTAYVWSTEGPHDRGAEVAGDSETDGARGGTGAEAAA